MTPCSSFPSPLMISSGRQWPQIFELEDKMFFNCTDIRSVRVWGHAGGPVLSLRTVADHIVQIASEPFSYFVNIKRMKHFSSRKKAGKRRVVGEWEDSFRKYSCSWLWCYFLHNWHQGESDVISFLSISSLLSRVMLIYNPIKNCLWEMWVLHSKWKSVGCGECCLSVFCFILVFECLVSLYLKVHTSW